MSSSIQSIVSALPTCVPSIQEPNSCVPAPDLLPTINVLGASIPVDSQSRSKLNRAAAASEANLSIADPVLSVPGYGDIYGLDERGEVVVVRSSLPGELEGGAVKVFQMDAARHDGGAARGGYGSYFGGSGCALSTGNASTLVCGNGSLETKVVTRRTRTTTAEKAKETDDRVVNLGLFVALLGILSLAV
ncbi:hypothetical protein B0O99DRAFT_693448 [Bisporella sp. PMI_857]|nr:hypothetical protein B0O99DRAFT_693448 [Bisporella sp. PMI_857]